MVYEQFSITKTVRTPARCCPGYGTKYKIQATAFISNELFSALCYAMRSTYCLAVRICKRDTPESLEMFHSKQATMIRPIISVRSSVELFSLHTLLLWLMHFITASLRHMILLFGIKTSYQLKKRLHTLTCWQK